MIKRILIGITMCAAAGLVYAGLIDAAATSGWTVKQTTRYKLEVYGYDARAYEFATENGMKCVMVFPGGSAVGWQMQCVPK